MKKINKISIKMITEVGMILAISICLNIISSIYVSRLFAEGWTINMSLIFIIVLVFRHNIWMAGLINLILAFIVSILIHPQSMFPPVASYSWWGILVSLFLDFFVANCISIIVSYFLSKILIKKKFQQILVIILIHTFISFCATFISGFLVWGIYAGNRGKYLYSFIYNFPAAIGSLIFALILFLPLYKKIPIIFYKLETSKNAF